MKLKLALVAVIVATVPLIPALASASTAAPARVHTIGSCTARGDFAVCVASGSINDPVSIQVHIFARSGQQVSGAWSMVCAKGSGAGSKSGNINGRASALHPLVQTLRMPYAHPDSCDVAADTQLSNSGSLRIVLTART